MAFIKQLFFLFLDILTHIFIALWLQQMSKVLKATALQRDNSFFFGKFFFFLILTGSNSKGSYAIALKFSAKQVNLMRKKSMPATCNIMNTLLT